MRVGEKELNREIPLHPHIRCDAACPPIFGAKRAGERSYCTRYKVEREDWSGVIEAFMPCEAVGGREDSVGDAHLAQDFFYQIKRAVECLCLTCGNNSYAEIVERGKRKLLQLEIVMDFGGIHILVSRA